MQTVLHCVTCFNISFLFASGKSQKLWNLKPNYIISSCNNILYKQFFNRSVYICVKFRWQSLYCFISKFIHTILVRMSPSSLWMQKIHCKNVFRCGSKNLCVVLKHKVNPQICVLIFWPAKYYFKFKRP